MGLLRRPGIAQFPLDPSGSAVLDAARKGGGHLRENLDDELGAGDPEHAHFLHYLHLLDDLGVPREEFDTYRERPGIKLALGLRGPNKAVGRVGG
ncbi:hypothetical protein [Streptomyces sp. NPDC051129]|uniref:hypothetical protein n=1 Tax=Streptomyces sp. NPDC051129 TaxID=3154639 RepID=UPI003425DB2A